MTTDTARQNLLRKIQALLAKAGSTDSDHEAEAFASKARQLMEEHQVEQHELGQDTDPLGEDLAPLRYDARCYVSVAAAAAQYFGCSAAFTNRVIDGRLRRCYRLFGREAARTTAGVMIEFWTSECMRRGRRLHRESGMFSSESRAVTEVLIAFAARLHRMSVQSPARPGQAGLPVPLTEAEALMRSTIEGLGTMRRVDQRFSRAASEEAGKVSLAMQTGSAAPRSRQIGG